VDEEKMKPVLYTVDWVTEKTSIRSVENPCQSSQEFLFWIASGGKD